MSNKNDPLVLAAVALFGYMMLSRSRFAQTIPGQPVRGPTSMPGSVGSGTAQAVGGLVGYVAQHIPQWFGSSNSNFGGGDGSTIISNLPTAVQDAVPLVGDGIETDPFNEVYWS
jgi:hypothetical protein